MRAGCLVLALVAWLVAWPTSAAPAAREVPAAAGSAAPDQSATASSMLPATDPAGAASESAAGAAGPPSTELEGGAVPGGDAASDGSAGDAAARVLELTNDQRAGAGLPPLGQSPALAEAAQDYTRVLAGGACFGHTCGPLPDLADRLGRVGYADWRAIGENVAAGYATPESVVDGWMASPGHRANILSAAYAEMGVGYVADASSPYGTYWTVDFGAHR